MRTPPPTPPRGPTPPGGPRGPTPPPRGPTPPSRGPAPLRPVVKVSVPRPKSRSPAWLARARRLILKPRQEWAAIAAEFTRIVKALGFTYVTLDLEGFRSGSMNALLPASSLLRST